MAAAIHVVPDDNFDDWVVRNDNGHEFGHYPTREAAEPVRSLWSRMLVADLASGAVPGVLVRMGNSVREVDVKSATSRAVGFYDAVQADHEATAAADHPTDLKALSGGAFDRLARHGFEVAD
jgi:NTE family protein